MTTMDHRTNFSLLLLAGLFCFASQELKENYFWTVGEEKYYKQIIMLASKLLDVKCQQFSSFKFTISTKTIQICQW